jgi:hypothetical protein
VPYATISLVFCISSLESNIRPNTALAPSEIACCSSRFIASLRESVASWVSAVISPPATVWQPAHAWPTTERERTVIPQHGPSTASISDPGGGNRVVAIRMR